MNIAKKESLAKLSFIYFLGTATSKGLAFFLFFLCTYFLTESEIGIYDIIITTIALAAPCINLMSDASIYRWLINAQTPDEQAKILESTFLIVLLSIAISITIYLGINVVFDIQFEYKYLALFYTILMTIYPVILQGLRGLSKLKDYTLTSIVFTLINVSLVFYFLKFTELRLKGVLLAHCISLFGVILFTIINNKWLIFVKSFKKFSGGYHRSLIKDFLKYSIPLLPNTLSWWLIGSAVKYVIFFYLGEHANGQFSVAYRFASILILITEVFTLAWQDKFLRFSNSSEAENYFNKILGDILPLIIGISLLIVGVSPLFFKLLKPEYSKSFHLIPIMVLSIGTQAICSFYGSIFIWVKKTKSIFTSSIVAGMATVFSSLFLVKFGLIGMTISILIGYILMLIIRILQSEKYLKAKFSLKKLFWLISTYVLVCFGVVYFDNHLILTLLGCCIIAALINYQNLSKVVAHKYKG